MKLIITGGGTGGHIYPAIAVAKKIRTAIPDVEVLFVGSEFGPEKRLVFQEQIRFEPIHVKSFNRNSFVKTIWALIHLIRALYESFVIMKRFKPDLVLGTGGYVSWPVVFMGQLMGIETLIHEQNAVPAWTTRILSNYAAKILISYKESIPYFKNQNRLYYTGNPVREEFLHISKPEARLALQIPENDFVVLFHGGSSGADIINDLALKLISSFDDYENLHLYVLTGKRQFKTVKKMAELQSCSSRIHIYDYSHSIVRLMRASDLVVCRAGAVALAEMTAIELPGILVPNPKSVDNHQEHNAKVFSKARACLVIEESETTSEQFINMFNKLFSHREQLAEMKRCFESIQRESALSTIISILYTYHLR